MIFGRKHATLRPDYTLSFRVHVCSSEHSNLSFFYRSTSLLYAFGTLTAFFFGDFLLFLFMSQNGFHFYCHTPWRFFICITTDRSKAVLPFAPFSHCYSSSTFYLYFIFLFRKARWPSAGKEWFSWLPSCAVLLYDVIIFVCFFPVWYLG